MSNLLENRKHTIKVDFQSNKKSFDGGKIMINDFKNNEDNAGEVENMQSTDTVKILGGRLKQLRENKGYSTAELGRRVGKSKATIVNYETGYRFPQIKDVHKLAEVLETSTSYIIGETDHNAPPLTKREALSLAELIKTNDFHANGQKLTDQDLDNIIKKLEGILREKDK